MADLEKQMTLLSGEDIANTVLYSLQQPDHLNVAEVFILPTEQGW